MGTSGSRGWTGGHTIGAPAGILPPWIARWADALTPREFATVYWWGSSKYRSPVEMARALDAPTRAIRLDLERAERKLIDFGGTSIGTADLQVAARALYVSHTSAEQGLVLMPAEATPTSSERPSRQVPEVIEDAPGEDGLKPDPSRAESVEGFLDLLREFWIWAGEYSSRRVADNSGGAFSHTTVTKLVGRKPGVRLTQEYIRGMIRGCGGNAAEEQRWVSAFRRLRRAEIEGDEGDPAADRPRRHLRSVTRPGESSAS